MEERERGSTEDLMALKREVNLASNFQFRGRSLCAVTPARDSGPRGLSQDDKAGTFYAY